MTLRKYLVAVLVAFFATSYAYVLVADDIAKQGPVKTVEARICELQIEKCELLEERLDQIREVYRRGDTSLDAVLNAEHDSLNARLRSCVAKSQRMETLRLILKNRNGMQEYRAANFGQGTGSADVLLLARADTLDARIALLKELPPHASLKTEE